MQEFQDFENTNMQTKVPSKSTRTREAKRKQYQRLSNHFENTDCSSEDKKVYFRPKFTRSQHQFLQKEDNFHSSAGISPDNAIAQSNNQRYSIDHHQQKS